MKRIEQKFLRKRNYLSQCDRTQHYDFFDGHCLRPKIYLFKLKNYFDFLNI
jgi:hypothetical protein